MRSDQAVPVELLGTAHVLGCAWVVGSVGFRGYCGRRGVGLVDVSVICDALAVVVSAGVPVLLWGSPGTGKTCVVRVLGAALDWPVEVVIGSIREPVDFAGLPVVHDGEVRMAPPVWARRLADAGFGVLSSS
jgi:hypothetical protein